MKLSHSQCSKYQQCPKAYSYHYVDRLRSTLSSAALLFGSALDAAFNELLRPEKGISPEDIFLKEFTTAKINNKEIDVPTCINLTYASSDLDFDLIDITSETKTRLLALKDKKSKWGLNSFSTEEKEFYNVHHWFSLKAKGLLMVKAYREKILPLITKVHDVQVEITLSNGEDSVTGFVDLVADLEGYGTVILDNKTSSIEYAKDSVITSPQLSLYMHALYSKYSTRKAGYIVLRKQVRKNKVKICSECGHDGSSARHATCPNTIEDKRCGGAWVETISPEIDIQIIIDTIPQQTEDIVIENYDVIRHAIENKIFPRNLLSCGNIYGGPCTYYNLCYKNSTTGLEEVE